jgi:hypothetical protein
MDPKVPPLLAEVLAKQPLPQRAFPWIPAGWRKEMHDLPEVLRYSTVFPSMLIGVWFARLYWPNSMARVSYRPSSVPWCGARVTRAMGRRGSAGCSPV